MHLGLSMKDLQYRLFPLNIDARGEVVLEF